MNELQKSVMAAFASTFVFYLKAQGFHWNVESRDFQEYHDLFGDIYSEVYGSIDGFAERIRTTGAYAPVSLAEILSYSKLTEEAVTASKDDMVRKLDADNDQMNTILREAYNICDMNSEFGFSNFLAERMDAHRKHGWKLKASQKM